ncbi:MAG: hypothetical protein ACFB9M_07810 [Myxococcota bacterium]
MSASSAQGVAGPKPPERRAVGQVAVTDGSERLEVDVTRLEALDRQSFLAYPCLAPGPVAPEMDLGDASWCLVTG